MDYRILIIGIIIGIILVFTISNIVYADSGCKWLSVSEQDFYSLVLCYLLDIHKQNEQIIEKLDWNNCVLDIQSRYSFSSPLLILQSCGERP